MSQWHYADRGRAAVEASHGAKIWPDYLDHVRRDLVSLNYTGHRF